MNVVIMGCGRVGSALAARLDAEGHAVTIMDTNADAFQRLPRDFRGAAIIGNGIDEQALQRAGIGSADVFVAVTQGDNRNLMAAQIAKHIFHVSRVVTRVYDQSRAVLYQELGLETINTTGIITGTIHQMIRQETAQTEGG